MGVFSNHNGLPRQVTRTSSRFALLVVSVVGLLAANAGAQYFKERDRAINFQQQLETSIKRRSAVFKVFSLLQDMEIVQRDFLLTENQKFLQEFIVVEQAMTAALESMMVHLISGEQQTRGQRLVDLIRERRLLLFDGPDRRPSSEIDDEVERLNIEEADRSLLEQAQTLTGEMLEIDGREIDRLSIEIRTQTTQSQIVVVALLGGILMLATAVSALGLAYFSHRNSIEGKLLDTMQKAEQASEAKTAFLASMSHEIRTPLTGILGYTELLLQDRLAERHRRFVERIQSAASSLSAIVNDILDFSKIEAGEVAFESEHFSLSALIENVTSITHVIADKKGLLVKVALDPAIPDSLVGDKARLQQVLLNLLGNAVKFTARGHVSVAARYEGSSAAGEMIRIEVSDTGIGFPPEKRDLLFRRFSQLDGSIGREFGGTGLGLAISRQLIEMMGGQIGAESEPGVGSTFWITLCLDRSDANEAQPTESKARGSVVAGRVLLVEDSEQNQELVSTILRAAGHTVDIASDGLAAIDAVQSAPYDLILMDVQMRRLDGISAAKRIRALDHPACQVPIIALTANVLPQQVNSYRDAGMNDFIAKPFTSKHLVASVSSWIQCEVAFPTVKDPIVTSENEHDEKSLGEIRELMGDDWVRASLRRLRDQINETFFDPNASPMDHVLLMGRAHLIVTSAAQLGFHALSRGCSELEESCSSGDGIDPSLMSARCFAQGAVKRIDELLAAAVPA